MAGGWNFNRLHQRRCTDCTMRVCSLSCPTFCNLMGCSPPGSSVRRILQARTLEWVAISSSRVSSQPRDPTHVSCVCCIGRWILYHWATWEVPYRLHRSAQKKCLTSFVCFWSLSGVGLFVASDSFGMDFSLLGSSVHGIFLGKMTGVGCHHYSLRKHVLKPHWRTSLTTQWLRLWLPVQGMRVWSLIRELRSHMSCSQK